MRFCLALHSGTLLLDARAAQQRADKSSATAEPELDEVNVPERLVYETLRTSEHIRVRPLHR